MNYKIVKEFPDDIIFEDVYPCISLYQHTHRYSPMNKQDPILFKNLLREIESSLKEKLKKIDLNSIMEPFYNIAGDKEFWTNTLDGLAVFANPDNCVVYRLYLPVQELAVVADSFHIKPLIRIFQSVDKYHLLGLSHDDFTLYEGNRFKIDKIKLDPGTNRTIEEVLGKQHTESYLTFGSYGDADGHAMYHGHGGRKDEVEKDIERFFRYVDRFVLDNYSKPTKLPLILVSLKEYHNIFKKISRNPYLMEKAVKGSYDAFETEKLKEKVWEIIEPIYSKKIQDLVNSYEDAKANSLGSDNLDKITMAVLENRVGTILIEADRIVPGKIDRNTGMVEIGDIKNPDYDDILDDLAEMVLKKKGEVMVLPEEKMPGITGVAAIYRY